MPSLQIEMEVNTPYEYYESRLGVKGCFLFSGRGEAADSLRLIGERGLRMRVERGAIIRLRRQAYGQPMLVLFESLPWDWQQSLKARFGEAREQRVREVLERYYRRNQAAFDFFNDYKTDKKRHLDNRQVEEYTLNASVLDAIGCVLSARVQIRMDLKCNGSEVKPIWTLATEESNRLRATIPHTLPENARRLQDRYNRYKEEGFESLIHGGFAQKNALKVDAVHESLLNNMFAGSPHKPTKKEVYDLYDGFLRGAVEITNLETGEMYDASGYEDAYGKRKEWRKLSESTVRNWLSKWENKIGTYAMRSGDRQRLMSLFKPYHSMLQPEQANSIVSIDDRQPVFEYANGKRAWFYNAIDLGSECFTTWVYGTSKEGIIIDFYREMVRNYTEWGLKIPAELECESNLNSPMRDGLLKEGNMFTYVRIEPNNARGKRIEQYYRPLRYQYEKKREGWLARPFALSEANQAGAEPKKIIPYDEIIAGCLDDIIRWNNMPHSKIKDKSRWEVFLATQNPKVRDTNWHGILPYIGYKTQTSVHAGIMNFHGDKWLLGSDGTICTGDRLIGLMMQVEGKDVEIRYIDGHKGQILKAFVYLHEGSTMRYVCEAVAQPKYNRARIEQTPEDLINRELMSKYVATIEGFGNRVRKTIDKVSIIDNRGNGLTDDPLRPVFMPEWMRGNSELRVPNSELRGMSSEFEARIVEVPEGEDEYDLNGVETEFKGRLIDTW